MVTCYCLFIAVIVQYTTAQATPYGVPNRVTNNARGMPNAIPMNRGMSNGIGRTVPITANNMADGRLINRLNLANPYYANNNIGYANSKLTNANFLNSLEPTLTNPLFGANQVLASDIATGTLRNVANTNLVSSITAPAGARLPNGASYNFGNSAIPVTVTGTSNGNQHVGINILADNLEVKGLVTVVGKMPIFGAVTLSGNVPSDGKASVNYSCGSPTAV